MKHLPKVKQKQKWSLKSKCELKCSTSSSTQYDILDFNHENDDIFDLSFQSTSELDETFVCSSDTTSSESEYNVSNFEYTDTLRKPRTDAFIVFWEALHTLFQYWLTYGKPSKVTKLFIIGLALIVNFACIRQHKNTWRSQKLMNRYYHGSITFAASVLFSANTFQKILKNSGWQKLHLYLKVAIMKFRKNSYFLLQMKLGFVNKEIYLTK